MDAFTLLMLFVFFMLGAVVTQMITAMRQPSAKDGPPPDEQAAEGPVVVTDLKALEMWIDPAQKPRLELDGQKVGPEEMTPEQRRRLINLINLMRPWVEAGAAAPAAASPAPAPVRPPGVTAAEVVAAAEAITAEPAKPRINLMDSARDFVGGLVVKKQEPQPASIVALIDKFLQAKLAESPLANRGISLEEGPLGEVRVLVGTQRYSGLDAVPDPQIQSIIREAIAEWEKKAVR